MDPRGLWIRKDRENYFLSGVMIACCAAAFISSYWHFVDRTSVRQRIKLRTKIESPAGDRKLRDNQFRPIQLKGPTTQYYKMEAPLVPSIPLPGEDE